MMTGDRGKRGIDPAAKLSELRGGGPPPADEVVREVEEIAEGSDETFSTRSADRNQKVMLELRKKTGDATALAYSYLVRADFDPSEGIVLDFSAYTVRLSGRNLRPVFAGIVAQRFAFVQETDDLHAEATPGATGPLVTGMTVTERP